MDHSTYETAGLDSEVVSLLQYGHQNVGRLGLGANHASVARAITAVGAARPCNTVGFGIGPAQRGRWDGIG